MSVSNDVAKISFLVLVDDAELCCLMGKAKKQAVAIYQKKDPEITDVS